MISAKTEAKKFIGWLERYNHPGGYEDIGEAMYQWLVADRGATRLGFDYATFMQMVVAVLVTAKGPLRVGVDVGQEKYGELPLPTSFGGWLPDRDDFQIAVDEAKRRDEIHGI